MSESGSHQTHSVQESLLLAIARAFSTVGGGVSLLLAAIACGFATCGVTSLMTLLLLCHLTSFPPTTSSNLFFDHSHSRATATLDLTDLYLPYSHHSTSPYLTWIVALKETLFPKLPDVTDHNHDHNPKKDTSNDDSERPELHPNVLQVITFRREHERHISRKAPRSRSDSFTLPPFEQEFRLKIQVKMPSWVISRASRKPILIVQATCELMSDSGDIIDRSTRQSLISSEQAPPPLSILGIIWQYSFWVPCKLTGSSFFCVSSPSIVIDLLLFESFFPTTSSESVRVVRVILGPSSPHRWEEHDARSDGTVEGMVTIVEDARLILEPKRGWIMRLLYRLRARKTLIVVWGLFAGCLALLGVMAVVVLLFLGLGLLKFASNQRVVDSEDQSLFDGTSHSGDEEGSEGARQSMEEPRAVNRDRAASVPVLINGALERQQPQLPLPLGPSHPSPIGLGQVARRTASQLQPDRPVWDP